MLRKPLIYALVTFAVTFLIAAVLMPAFLVEFFYGSDYEGWRPVPGRGTRHVSLPGNLRGHRGLDRLESPR